MQERQQQVAHLMQSASRIGALQALQASRVAEHRHRHRPAINLINDQAGESRARPGWRLALTPALRRAYANYKACHEEVHYALCTMYAHALCTMHWDSDNANVCVCVRTRCPLWAPRGVPPVVPRATPRDTLIIQQQRSSADSAVVRVRDRDTR
jgi:hypothetical protein